MSVLQVRHWKLTACVLYSLISGFWWDYNSKNIFAHSHTHTQRWWGMHDCQFTAGKMRGERGLLLERAQFSLMGKVQKWEFSSFSSCFDDRHNVDGIMQSSKCHRKSFSFNRCSLSCSSRTKQMMFELNYKQLLWDGEYIYILHNCNEWPYPNRERVMTIMCGCIL